MNFRKSKASESNNYTFETDEILLTIVTYRKSGLQYIFKKCFLFIPIMEIRGEIEFYLLTEMGKSYPAEQCTHNRFFQTAFSPEAVFLFEHISDFPSSSLKCSGTLAPLSLSGH